jgi:hypothetical protein
MSKSTAPNRNVDPNLGSRPSWTRRPDHGRSVSPTAEGQHAIARPRRASAAGTSHFLRHFGEMFVAMMVGMCALGALDGLILSVAGTSVAHVRNSAPEVVALVMALNMTVGMTLWMRYRRHSWPMCAEMAGAMFVPAVIAIVLFWCAVIHIHSVTAVEMAAMVPAMIVVMLLRRTAYSQPVHKHAQEVAARSS